MNSNTSQADVGYLVVRVSTARGAIPLSDASVSIRGEDTDRSGILYSLSTNADGMTERVSLPAPARGDSDRPGASKPFATYSVDVFKEGYIPLYFQNVPIFASILSIQPAVMIPAPDGTPDERFPPLTGSTVNEEAYGKLRGRRMQ